MPSSLVAHTVQDLAERVGPQAYLFLGLLAIAALLNLWHLRIKHRGLPRRVLGSWVGLVAIIAVVSTVALPARTSAQDPQPSPGLPDLISDRPFIWFDKVVENPDGALARVLAFDGYLHNVGEGSLDLLGNPQVEGGVKQRVFDGESWEEVGAPTVRYETSDGHDHFHLIGAVDYSLWAESRAHKIGDSAKVGFCLVDTEQIEETHDEFYGLMRFGYCNQNDPQATELRMGITPGWRDTYDASITLQWVDVSDVQPGRYWVGAITDPLDEIVESDDENNKLVFSINTFPVSGYTPVAAAAVEVVGDTVIDLQVLATATVGPPAWTIVSPPQHGSLDVPTGVAFGEPQLVYRPDPGFTGSDSFRYHVRDSSRIFPERPRPQVVELVVGEPADDRDEPNEPPTFDEPGRTIESAEFALVEESFAASDPDGDSIRWFGENLPAGVRLDESSGVASGVPTARGVYRSQIVAWDGWTATSIAVDWDVAAISSDTNLRPQNVLSSVYDERVWIALGERAAGASYEAEGLPDGLEIAKSSPRVSGTPTAVGSYSVVVRQFVNGVETQMIEFDWEVRPAARVAFAL